MFMYMGVSLRGVPGPGLSTAIGLGYPVGRGAVSPQGWLRALPTPEVTQQRAAPAFKTRPPHPVRSLDLVSPKAVPFFCFGPSIFGPPLPHPDTTHCPLPGPGTTPMSPPRPAVCPFGPCPIASQPSLTTPSWAQLLCSSQVSTPYSAYLALPSLA
jgi:hypothetical protein